MHNLWCGKHTRPMTNKTLPPTELPLFCQSHSWVVSVMPVVSWALWSLCSSSTTVCSVTCGCPCTVNIVHHLHMWGDEWLDTWWSTDMLWTKHWHPWKRCAGTLYYNIHTYHIKDCVDMCVRLSFCLWVPRTLVLICLALSAYLRVL